VGRPVLAAIAWLVRAARDVVLGSRTFYRAVSPAEYADLRQSGRLDSVLQAMTTAKFFAVRYADAHRWGVRLHPGQPFHIIKARWRVSRLGQDAGTYAGFKFWAKLDHIGPAWTAPCEAWPDATINVTLCWWDRL